MQQTLPSETELNRLLDKTKGRLFFKKQAGFLSSLVCDHTYVWDETAPTAWNNSEVIGFNPYFFYWLTVEERVTLLAHELWHSGYDHFTRFEELSISKNHEIHNQAADHVINLNLQENGYVFGDKLMSVEPCIDPRFTGMFTEQVYKILLKEKPEQSPCPPSGDGQAGSGQGQWSGDLKAPPSTSTQLDRQTKIVKAQQSAQMSKTAGDIPGEISLLVDRFLKPILPWETLLQKWMNQQSRDNYSFQRPRRRYEDVYLPSMMGKNTLDHLIYYVDVSGSISDEAVKRFNSEVHHIHAVVRPVRLTVVTFDTRIQDTYDFWQDDPFKKIEIHGRGGTKLRPVYDHMMKHRPSAAVVFSDMFVTPMHINPRIPILWVVEGNPDVQIPFGKAIHIPNQRKAA
jgi:predicted metal-dependent peptidase